MEVSQGSDQTAIVAYIRGYYGRVELYNISEHKNRWEIRHLHPKRKWPFKTASSKWRSSLKLLKGQPRRRKKSLKSTKRKQRIPWRKMMTNRPKCTWWVQLPSTTNVYWCPSSPFHSTNRLENGLHVWSSKVDEEQRATNQQLHQSH